MWEDPYDKYYSSKKPPPSSVDMQDPYKNYYATVDFSLESKDTTPPVKSENKFANFLQQFQPGEPGSIPSKVGKRALSLLGVIGEGLAGATWFPITRTLKNAAENAPLSKVLKDMLPIPYVGEKVWGEDVLKAAGAPAGWQRTALGLAGDLALDPIIYAGMGETKATKLTKLASTAKQGSKVAKQIAKYERAGKILPTLGKTVEEQIKLGQTGFKFAGKVPLPELQSKIYGKILNPIKETFLQSGLGKQLSTKYGSPEVRATHEMFMNEIHSNPEIISKIQKGMHERTKIAEQLA